jgi:hypothetical protein
VWTANDARHHADDPLESDIMSPAANNTIDRWFDRLDRSMKSWGTSTIILGVIIAFAWRHGGPWVDAKAESEKAIGVAFKALVAASEKQERNSQDWKAFTEQVASEHRQHSEILREITAVLKGLCESGRPKNQPTQPATES